MLVTIIFSVYYTIFTIHESDLSRKLQFKQNLIFIGLTYNETKQFFRFLKIEAFRHVRF